MRGYYFADRFARPVDRPLRFFNQDEALRFLRQAATDAGTLSELRDWAGRRASGGKSNRDLLEYAARSIVTGALQVGMHYREFGRGGAVADDVVQARSAGPSATPSSMRQRSPEQQPKAPPQTEPDVDKQVAVLTAAALSGVPFCEQCEKAKAEAA